MTKSKEKNSVGKSPDTVSVDGGPQLRERETWTNKFDFVLACIGFSVGLGNVWRFPYLCYKNGGGAFLIPYFICVVIGGVPLFYLEVSVGQFMGVSGLKAWNIVPLFQGIGVATTIIVFFLNCYYNVILCWSFYYFFASFTLELPWTTCGNWWNTEEHCSEFLGTNCTNITTSDDPGFETICTNSSHFWNGTKKPYQVDPVTEYWERRVLGISDSISDMGTIKWDLCLCLLLAWIVVYVCICKGIKSSGKVMYVTATTPYLFMLALLIRNCLLEGSVDGILFYLKPDIAKLTDMEVWVDAGTQIFFSYSIGIGALTALGSYNKFKHNSYRDTIIFACTNSGTSFFAGFIIFSILGYMAHTQGVPIKDVAGSGPGLAFIAYPMAVAQMPGAPVWSALFFLMLILLGLDSQFVGVEGVVSSVVDMWPEFLRVGYRREIFIAILCTLKFLVGLSMVTNGGMYVFQLFDYYSGSKIILFVAFFECIAIAWVYGIRRFYDNLEMMLGFRILPVMMVCWTVLSPIFCMAVFITSIINYSELDYKRPSGEVYVFPSWAVGMGWGMAALSAIWIPLVMIFKIFKYGPKNFSLLLKPFGLKPHQLRPQDYGEPTLADLKAPRLDDIPTRSLELEAPPPPYMYPGTAIDNLSYQPDEKVINSHWLDQTRL